MKLPDIAFSAVMVRGLLIDGMLVVGLGLLFSAVHEIDPLLARGGLGFVLFTGGAIGAWRRAG